MNVKLWKDIESGRVGEGEFEIDSLDMNFIQYYEFQQVDSLGHNLNDPERIIQNLN